MIRPWRSALIALLVLLPFVLLAACGDDDDDDDDDNDDNDDAGVFSEAEANPGTWTWIDVDGAICRDGTPTGIGVRLVEGSTKLAIFLEGGGACYSPSSCADNPSHYDATDLAADAADLSVGAFDMDDAANPLSGYNFVYIPYCTGDVHAGNRPQGPVQGVDELQDFVGFQNVTADVGVFAPYFADATDVFMFGASAGSFGTMINYHQVADAFDVPVNALADSGPLPEDDDVLAPCYQGLLRIQWTADESLPEGCTECFAVDGFPKLYAYYADAYPDAAFGLFTSLQDMTIRDFFGLGQNNCQGTTPIPGDAYETGMLGLRDDIFIPSGSWGSYFIAGDSHTIVKDADMFSNTTVGGTAFTDWFADLVDGSISQVAPD